MQTGSSFNKQAARPIELGTSGGGAAAAADYGRVGPCCRRRLCVIVLYQPVPGRPMRETLV